MSSYYGLNIYPGARTIALRRDLDPMSIFYEERSAGNRRKHFNVKEPPLPGLSIFIHGLILSGCEHFSIDFLTLRGEGFDDDVILQLGARLPQNYIVRNSRLMGKWGPEENSSNLPFQLQRGQSFWLQILLTEETYYISVNGYHFAKYDHRMPYRWLAAVDVRGDVADVVIDSFYVTEYPIRLSKSMARNLPFVYRTSVIRWEQEGHSMPRKWLQVDTKFHKMLHQWKSQLTLPFYGRMPTLEKLVVGRSLRIEGRVRLMPQSFSVALQSGQQIWPQPTVSFFFSTSFLHNSRNKLGKAIITRCAYVNDAWVNREVSRLHTNLRPGSAFVIVIACLQHCYELFVNNKLLLSFRHQMSPETVDIVNIRGDIRLWDVVVESFKVEQVKTATARKVFHRVLENVRTKRSTT